MGLTKEDEELLNGRDDDSNFLWALGIDPGEKGSTVILSLSDMSWAALRHSKIPKSKDSSFDTRQYLELIRKMMPEDLATVRVFMERPLILSKQRGAAKIGINWGKLAAAFNMADMEIAVVMPAKWKDDMMPSKDFRHEHGKNASVVMAETIGFQIPSLNPKGTVKDNNIADALLIALWGARDRLKRVTNGEQ
jgi:hypothetical protein